MGLFERSRSKRSVDRDADARDARVRDVSVRDARRDPGVRAARQTFGGLDLPATLVGTLTALAVLILLGGLVGAAIGAVGYQTGLKGTAEEISIASLIGGLIVLFIAFLVGGWAAGRMARYDGARNGLVTAVWAIVLAAVLSALAALFGAQYDVFRNVELPQFFSRDALTLGGIVSALVAIAVMLVAGLLGGKWGERYHRRVDAAVLSVESR
jgi:CBS domain containing-hemolysin-like protein